MLLEIENMSASYGKALALENISMHIAPGEFVAVLGPNGAGKSTLLKCISRMLGAEGTLKFNGESLHGYPAHEVVGRGICHCPEGRRLFPELTVLKNLMLGAYLRDDADGSDAWEDSACGAGDARHPQRIAIRIGDSEAVVFVPERADVSFRRFLDPE